jgi:hypothetical protein
VLRRILRFLHSDNPNYFTEEEQIEYVKKHYCNIQFINNPTIEMVKIAIDYGCTLWDKDWKYIVDEWNPEVQDYINNYREVEDILC